MFGDGLEKHMSTLLMGLNPERFGLVPSGGGEGVSQKAA